MDVTPKSKQPGSLKRRPLSLTKSVKTKLLKTDLPISESRAQADSPEDDKELNAENAPSIIEPQHCTPVRRISLQNAESPKYPHMFRIFHDESPELRVSWDDGISETVPTRKEQPMFDTSIVSRSMMSQHYHRPHKKFSTPPSLKQKPVTADVAEYMQWAHSLVEKAKSFLPQSSSSSDSSSLPEPDKAKDALSCDSEEILTKDRRSLPSSSFSPLNSDFSCSTRNNSVTDRFSLPSSNLTHSSTNRVSLPSSDTNYSDMFDDSANDDMFMKCSQAVEDSLLKSNSNVRKTLPLSVNTANSNINFRCDGKKFSSSTPQIISKVSECDPSLSTNQGANKSHNFITPNNVPIINKFQSRSSEGLGAVSNSTVKTSVSNYDQKRSSAESFIPKPSSSSSVSLSSSSSSKDSGIDIQLLDEDDDFLCSVDLQSLSQMVPPPSLNVPTHLTKKYSHSPSSPVLSSKSSVSAIKANVSAANGSVSASVGAVRPKISTNISVPKPNSSTNVNVMKPNVSGNVIAPNLKANANVSAAKPIVNRIVNSVVNVAAKPGKICSQDVINKKRLEAQRRLQSKMQRHLTM